MKLVFVTNFWNHYQASLGQAFADELGHDQFRMVLCEPLDEERKYLGWGECGEPPSWLIGPARRPDQLQEYVPTVMGADVAIMGASPGWMQRQRAKTGKLTFIASERPWKMPLHAWRFLNPRFLLSLHAFRRTANWPNVHLLGIGAYTAADVRAIRAFGDRVWSWGYFVQAPPSLPVREGPDQPFRILWAGRMIAWKRVDVLLRACAVLKDRYDWHLNLVGGGEERHRLGLLTKELGLQSRVTFHGPLAPDVVRDVMRQSHAYVLASDRNEGWGVVANEAIAEGSVLIANEHAGASKVLIQHGRTGYLFQDGNDGMLANILAKLMDNEGLLNRIRAQAWDHHKELWSPRTAAGRMAKIIAAHAAGAPWPVYEDGPCVNTSLCGSKARRPWRGEETKGTASRSRQRIACVFNYAPHYRAAIYHLLDQELGCDFYFGANLLGKDRIEKMDVNALQGFKRESRVFGFRYAWQCGYPWLSIRKYDAFILTGDPRLSNGLLLLLCKMAGKRVYLWGHGVKDTTAPLSRYARWFYTRATGWFIYGDRGRLIMEGLGVDPARLHVIYNSLDYDRQLAVRNTLGPTLIYRTHFGNDAPTLLFIGRLTPQKKLPMLLHAAANLIRRATRPNIVLVGTGSAEGELRDLASQLGIAERVWFYGACHQEEVLGGLVYNASACVSPGAVGLMAMHALVYGCPVVTHNDLDKQAPECEAITGGKTGHFFRHGDQASLEEAIIRTLALDRERARADCHRVIDEKYNPHRQIQTFKSVLGRGPRAHDDARTTEFSKSGV